MQPFHMAAKLLKNKQYLTLAASKSIETILLMAFEDFTSINSSLDSHGIIFAEKLNGSLIHHLNSKKSSSQNKGKFVKIK